MSPRDHSRPELHPTVQDQGPGDGPLAWEGPLGFSLLPTFPGWLTKCTGLPGVLELKVTSCLALGSLQTPVQFLLLTVPGPQTEASL